MDTAQPGIVQEVVATVGGPTKASIACRVSNKAIYQWYELGHVPRTRYAVLLAEAWARETRADALEELRMVRRLAGLEMPDPDDGERAEAEDAPERAPTRHESRAAA